MDRKDVWFLILRYAILVLLGFFQLSLFYFIFTPLTVYPVFWIVSLFEEGSRLLTGNLLYFSGFYAEIIPACIAGAAYYLLLILNLVTPMEGRKRVKSLVFLVGTFLVLNIVRILVFIFLLIGGYEYFDLAHEYTWYFGSTVLVIVIWFVNVWIFKIKSIPIFSDFKNIVKDVKNR